MTNSTQPKVEQFEIHFARTFPDGSSVKVLVSGPVLARNIRSLIRHLEILAEEYPDAEVQEAPK